MNVRDQGGRFAGVMKNLPDIKVVVAKSATAPRTAPPDLAELVPQEPPAATQAVADIFQLNPVSTPAESEVGA